MRLPNFQGIAVHDYMKAYYSYFCLHALCGAHILRELVFLYEVEEQKWAKEFLDLLLYMYRKVKMAKERGATALDVRTVRSLEEKYTALHRKSARQVPICKRRNGKRGRIKQSKARNMIDRLRDRRNDIIGFIHDFKIPFDNNEAERSFRMVKVHQKISSCFRSFKGAEMFCRIRSYIATVKKNDQPVLDSIAMAIRGDPYLPSES